MANNNTLCARNEAARILAKTKNGRSAKRITAKTKALTEMNKPMRVRLGLTKV